MKRLAVLMLAGLSIAATAAPSRYLNARFHYAISYPADLLVPLPEADNGDGRGFRPKRGGGTFLVFGSYPQDDWSPAAHAAVRITECLKPTAAYRIAKPALVAVSCETAKGIRYSKSVLSKGTLVEFSALYPVAERAQWDKAVARMAGSMTFLP